MFVTNQSGQGNIHKMTVGSGGYTKGDLLSISSNTAINTDYAAMTVLTCLGIALSTEDAASTGLVQYVNSSSIICADVDTTATKTTVAITDIGKKFDLSDAHTVDLDDTTGGYFVCTGYNNDRGVIYGKIDPAKLFV